MSNSARRPRPAAIDRPQVRRPRIRAGADWPFEQALQRQGWSPLAGADEAGRGAAAGPLVAAAVAMHDVRHAWTKGIRDSKLLTAERRAELHQLIMRRAAAVAVVVVPAKEVDELGLHRANVEALRRAASRLELRPGYVLTDGFGVPGLPAPGLAVQKGDRVCVTIAAASIVAKVTRDALMVAMADDWPGYGFEVHKGYLTADHRQAMADLGPCPQHRRCFEPVRTLLNPQS